MENKTKFNRSITLSQVVEELEENGMKEITRIMSHEDKVWTFEYNTK